MFAPVFRNIPKIRSTVFGWKQKRAVMSVLGPKQTMTEKRDARHAVGRTVIISATRSWFFFSLYIRRSLVSDTWIIKCSEAIGLKKITHFGWDNYDETVSVCFTVSTSRKTNSPWLDASCFSFPPFFDYFDSCPTIGSNWVSVFYFV